MLAAIACQATVSPTTKGLASATPVARKKPSKIIVKGGVKLAMIVIFFTWHADFTCATHPADVPSLEAQPSANASEIKKAAAETFTLTGVEAIGGREAQGLRIGVIVEALKKVKTEAKALKIENEKLKSNNNSLVEYYNHAEEMTKAFCEDADEAKGACRSRQG
uniref:Uncharacterized protein n=1 Tax=Oryza punctata TaxID=4537 RepID=A0A0E0ML72_ORYPU